ncbi:MAG TPA: TonB family protein [Nitrospira sp.]|nr:TonB family protein [Nitrospira sp.]
MNDPVSLQFERTSSMATGWLVSCLLHSGFAIAAILFMQRLQLAPQAEPFQWDVTITTAPSPSLDSIATVESRPSTTPASERSTATADSGARSGRTRIETAVPLSSSHSAPTHEQPSPTTHASPALLPQSPSLVAEPMDQPEHEPLPQPVETGSEAPGSPAQMELPTQPYSISGQPQPTLQHQSVSSAEDEITQQPSIASVPSVSSPADIGEFKPTRAQHGWLADLMAKWIEDLNKRYPAMLRTEGIQGKVTLTAMLHEDGRLSDVRIIKSSGNLSLDQVALEDVKNGPSIKLSRPLERPHMSVKFSISYDLKTAQ